MKKILVVLTIIFAFFLPLGIGAEDKKEFNFEFFNYFHDDSLMENLLKAQENNLDLKIANIKLVDFFAKISYFFIKNCCKIELNML